MREIRKILCPVDFSSGSDAMVNDTVELAAQLGAEVHLLHVYEMPLYQTPVGVDPSAGLPGGLMDVVQGVKKAVSERLEKLRASVDGRGVTLHTRMTEGRPAKSIVSIAGDESFDLVCMGTRGWTGLRHLLLGSVAEHVVRASPCPVLTFPTPDDEG